MGISADTVSRLRLSFTNFEGGEDISFDIGKARARQEKKVQLKMKAFK